MKRFSWLISAALAMGGATVEAQTYPARSVSLIVPFAAGGPSDALARLLAYSMSTSLGQQMVVEDITGAGGTIAATRAAQARPDGHTVLLAHIGQATSVTLYRKLSYHPVDAFDTVGMIAEVPMVVIGRKDFGPKDARDLISFIRANRGKVSYGNGGVGSASHLCGLLLMSSMKAEMTTVVLSGVGAGDE